jgi:hypothetical protein
MPGVAISVDPSGMPTGRVDCGLRGDVASIPAGDCVPGTVVCAMAAAEISHKAPVATIAPRLMKKSRYDPDLRAPALLDGCCLRMA